MNDMTKQNQNGCCTTTATATTQATSDARPFDRIFNDLFDGFTTRPRGDWMPAADVTEASDHVDIRIDLPGIEKDRIEISIEEGTLLISGTRDETKVEEGKSELRRERRTGSFTRRFTIGNRFDAEKIQAEYRDGVLHLHVPKAEAAVAKRIEIS